MTEPHPYSPPFVVPAGLTGPDRETYLAEVTRYMVAVATIIPGSLLTGVRRHLDRLVPDCGLDQVPQYLGSVGPVFEDVADISGEWDWWNPDDYPFDFDDVCPIRQTLPPQSGSVVRVVVDHLLTNPTEQGLSDVDFTEVPVADLPAASGEVEVAWFAVRAAEPGTAAAAVARLVAMAGAAANAGEPAQNRNVSLDAGGRVWNLELTRSWRSVRAGQPTDSHTQEWLEAFTFQLYRLAAGDYTDQEANTRAWVKSAWVDQPDGEDAVVFDLRGSVDLACHRVFAHTPFDTVPAPPVDAADPALIVRLGVPADSLAAALRSALLLVDRAGRCADLVMRHRAGARAG